MTHTVAHEKPHHPIRLTPTAAARSLTTSSVLLLALGLGGCLTQARVLQLGDAGSDSDQRLMHDAGTSRSNVDSGAMTQADAGFSMTTDTTGFANGETVVQTDAGTTAITGQYTGSPQVMPSPAPSKLCKNGGLCLPIASSNVDKLDLLFVIDDSGSMVEEQAALKAQMPHMLDMLATGMRSPTDTHPFPPFQDVHIGVIDTDMGLPGIPDVGGCTGFGDDGILRHTPDSSKACRALAPFPSFVSYVTGNGVSPSDAAESFACIASLGTMGCGFEQPLEATLKALWPSVDVDQTTGQVYMPNRVTFLGNTLGHGDEENQGFLRNDPALGQSMIGVIVVSDEDDGSAPNVDIYKLKEDLSPDSPYFNQDLNLRTFYNSDRLYPTYRYVNALRALRPEHPERVFFGAIGGIPPDLVDSTALSKVNFDDEMSRIEFYDTLRNDARMVPTLDPSTMPGSGNGNLKPSCITKNGTAYPPTRAVDVAQRFGQNGFIQSLCQTDFASAVDAMITRLSRAALPACVSQSLGRDGDGKVDCDLVWQLPAPGQNTASTPTTCEQRDFLSTSKSRTTDDGSTLCLVKQVAVSNGNVAQDDGWYFDDFSNEEATECNGASSTGRVAFTPAAKPPADVHVFLDCK